MSDHDEEEDEKDEGVVAYNYFQLRIRFCCFDYVAADHGKMEFLKHLLLIDSKKYDDAAVGVGSDEVDIEVGGGCFVMILMMMMMMM